jgi:methyl-accepting chemotaxis protein
MTKTSQRSYKRKKKLINKDLQGKLIFRSFLLAFFTIVVFTAVLLYVSSDNLMISFEQQRLQVGSSSLVMLSQMLKSNWIALLIAGVVIVLISIVHTHRLVGPIYHYEQTMLAMLKKDISKHIYLRDKDEFRAMADYLNQFNAGLSTDLSQLDSHCLELDRALKQNDVQTATQHVAAIRAVIGSYTLKQ